MIQLQKLQYSAGIFRLSDVSVTIETGQYAVLMGRTGQGKTTLLELICGLRHPTSGRILIGGTDVTGWSPGDRQVGYVPQDLALFPHMNVRGHLEYALKLRKQSANTIRQRVDEVAQWLGVTHLLERRVTGLSGGEAQRVALGRALSFRPSVLLLDEPLSALDEQTRGEMHELLRRIKATTGMTTLHITHNSDEAAALADVQWRLIDGQIVPVGDGPRHRA